MVKKQRQLSIFLSVIEWMLIHRMDSILHTEQNDCHSYDVFYHFVKCSQTKSYFLWIWMEMNGKRYASMRYKHSPFASCYYELFSMVNKRTKYSFNGLLQKFYHFSYLQANRSRQRTKNKPDKYGRFIKIVQQRRKIKEKLMLLKYIFPNFSLIWQNIHNAPTKLYRIFEEGIIFSLRLIACAFHNNIVFRIWVTVKQTDLVLKHITIFATRLHRTVNNQA